MTGQSRSHRPSPKRPNENGTEEKTTNMNTTNCYLQPDIIQTVRWALQEDIRDGDITARLIPEEALAQAQIITRERAVICGTAWVDEVFRQVDPGITLAWQVADGEQVQANQLLVRLQGPARGLLTGERSALNFLQTLSGTATSAHRYASIVAGTGVKLLDTRKTLPGLRSAQKYAVTCGGCFNHRQGLHDAYLIKENHITACGSIAAAIHKARELAPGKPVEVEVENQSELAEALQAGADIIMLDDFTPEQMVEAVRMTAGRSRLEASGGVNEESLKVIAQTGVDFISIGRLTKDCKAIDLSMRLTQTIKAGK
jgi:nicotinate-nucleotide pyrophosphorylase (carboxylating)